MPHNKKPPQAQFISPDNYPQMLSKPNAARALATLRSDTTMAKAETAMAEAVPPLKAAILDYVARMEAAGGDPALVFEQVHEIRGLAENADMVSTGRIAEVLCRYMDDMQRIGKPADAGIVALHVAAISRAAAAEEDDVRMGEIVAAELAALVARKLLDAQGPELKAR